jgi:hypothetical protein
MEMATRMGKNLGSTVIALSCFAALGSGRVALAASHDFGDFLDTSVGYLQVTTSSPTDPTGEPFGTPTLSAESLVFSPPAFAAESAGGGTNTITGGLSTTVVGLDDMGISTLEVQDAGDYTLVGSGTAATDVTLSSPVTVTISDLNNSPITPIVIPTSITFSPSSSFNLAADPGSSIWTGDLNVDLAAAIAGAGDSGTATSVGLSISDTLTATSESGSIAEIEKKARDVISITTTVQAVPEPTSIGLLTIAGGALLKRRRRI